MLKKKKIHNPSFALRKTADEQPLLTDKNLTLFSHGKKMSENRFYLSANTEPKI